MKKRFNWLGFTGLLLLLTGAIIFRSRGGWIPWFLSWILGPLLWYLGGGLVIASLVQRLFASSEKAAETAVRETFVANPVKETEISMKKAHVVVVLSVVLLSVTAVQAAPPAAADAQPVFAGKCAMCHGADGAGKTPMGAKLQLKDLRDESIQKQSDAELAKTIGAGKGKMQGFAQKLTKQQIDDLAAYVHGLKK